MFNDRHDAGVQLAEKLRAYVDADAIVLALPRGGVPVGYEVAKALALPLDIFAVRKIGHPHAPEFAIGAVDSEGRTLFADAEITSVDPQWLKGEVEQECAEAKRCANVYRSGQRELDVSGKTIIIVDDGVATGLTLRLAIASLREKKPRHIVAAIPVIPQDAREQIVTEADEVVAVLIPESFVGSVGAYYEQFEQVEDQEVIQLLKEKA